MTGIRSSKFRERLATVAVALIGILILLFLLFSALLLGLPLLDRQVERHKSDAAAFAQRETSHLLRLPKEAQVLEVEKRSNWFDYFYVIKFTLPNTQTPEQWLRLIWASNKFAPGSQEGPFSFSAYHSDYVEAGRTWKRSSLHHGHRRVEYRTAEQTYRAEIGTD